MPEQGSNERTRNRASWRDVQVSPASHLERLSEGEVGEEDILLQHVADLSLPAFTQALPVESDAARLQSDPS